MFVEYLMEIHPFTILLICLSILFSEYFYSLFTVKIKRISDLKIQEIREKIINLKNDKIQNVTVGSYNLMAYNFTKVVNYSQCDEEILSIKYRAPRILRQILSLNYDIFCLQEVDRDLFYEFYKPNFESAGYDTIINNNTNNVTIVTIYKVDKFLLEKSHFIDLNEDLSKLDDNFLKYKEAHVILLKVIKTGKKLTITNTHIFWNPEFEFVKYGQVSKILSFLLTNYCDVPKIFAGDFNSLPWSNVLRYIYKIPPIINSSSKGDYHKNKKFMEMFFEEYKHNLELKSAYEVYKTDRKDSSTFNNIDETRFNELADNHPDFTNSTSEFTGCLDYIFYTKNDFELCSLVEVPNTNEMRKLPNKDYPSDHLIIGCSLNII